LGYVVCSPQNDLSVGWDVKPYSLTMPDGEMAAVNQKVLICWHIFA